MKRLAVVVVSSSAMLFAQMHSLAGPHEEGVAAGRASIPAVRGSINAGTASSAVPGYTTTPPETALYGVPSLAGRASGRLAACRAEPRDPTCEALQTAISSANTARPPIGAYDPAVSAARGIARNPTSTLGSLSAYYAGCRTEAVHTPPGTSRQQCLRIPSGAPYSCTRRLTVQLDVTNNCPAGEWFAHAEHSGVGLDVQCRPSQPLQRQHFRVTAAGEPVAHFDLDMSAPGSCPSLVASIGSLGVWAGDRSCTAGNCSLTAIVAPQDVWTCEWSENGDRCTLTPTFLPIYEPCGPGELGGHALMVTTCSGEVGCVSYTLDEATCYAPDPQGTIVATDLTRTYDSWTWRITGMRSQSGCRLNPAVGPVPTFTLSYVLPGATVREFDRWDDECASSFGGRCTPAGPTRCTEGAATRQVSGRDVTRACWAYESPVSCRSGAYAADQCAPLVERGCRRVDSQCTRTAVAGSGPCESYVDTFECATAGTTTTTASSCPRDVFCLGASCFNIAYANDEDFARAMTYMEAAREAGVYLDVDRLQVFNGEPDSCRDRALANCCFADSAGKSMSNQSVFGSGSTLVYDILMNSENREFLYQGMAALLTGSGFSGSFTAYGFTVAVNGTALPAGSTVLYSSSAVAGEGLVIAFDPWTLVIAIIIYIILSLMECSAGEAKLALKEGAGLCHTVPPPYCSSCVMVLGTCVTCLEYTTGKCCFNSMLARIINEQGRAQIGKGWGTAQGPDCSGFTIAELQSLSFDRMDFSEFYASIVPVMPEAGSIQGSNVRRLPACYYGQGRC